MASLFSHSIARSSRWLSVGCAIALHLRFVDRLGSRGRRQRFREQEFKLFRADAPAPDRHRGAIQRQLGLEIGLAAEELEIRVFDPLRADLIVRDSARVLEQMQPDHQSGG